MIVILTDDVAVKVDNISTIEVVNVAGGYALSVSLDNGHNYIVGHFSTKAEAQESMRMIVERSARERR